MPSPHCPKSERGQEPRGRPYGCSGERSQMCAHEKMADYDALKGESERTHDYCRVLCRVIGSAMLHGRDHKCGKSHRWRCAEQASEALRSQTVAQNCKRRYNSPSDQEADNVLTHLFFQ